MKRLSVLAAIALLLALNVTVMAQDEEEAVDVVELCFNAGLGVPSGAISSWHNDSLGAKLGWSLGVDVGFFARYNVIVGFNFTYTQFGVDASDDAEGTHHRLYNPNLYLKYFFVGESNFEPYLKAHVGVENAKFTTLRTQPEKRYAAISYDPALALGFGGGIFYYSADFSGLFLEANYHWAKTKDVQREYDAETMVFGDNLGVIDIHMGIRVLIGSGE